MCRYRYKYSHRHWLARQSCAGQRGPAHPCSRPAVAPTPAALFVSFPRWDEAQRAVTQLLGWVVSSQCLAEISPPWHPPFIPGFLFAFVLTHKTKTLLRTAAVEASVRGQSGDDRGEVSQSKWPSESPGLLNGKYGKGAMSVCTCWDPPMSHIRCCRNLYHYLLRHPERSPVLSTQCRQRNGAWVVIPLNFSHAGRAVNVETMWSSFDLFSSDSLCL